MSVPVDTSFVSNTSISQSIEPPLRLPMTDYLLLRGQRGEQCVVHMGSEELRGDLESRESVSVSIDRVDVASKVLTWPAVRVRR